MKDWGDGGGTVKFCPHNQGHFKMENKELTDAFDQKWVGCAENYCVENQRKELKSFKGAKHGQNALIFTTSC